jgi:CheY-like chemotaxis protein
MDVSMPEMDGLEATYAIREKEKSLGGHIVIVAMTAFATKEYHEKCLAAGMDSYVTKPVRIDELDKTLAPLMAQTPAPAPASATPSASLPSPVDLTQALESVGGDVDIMLEAIAIVLEEVPPQRQALQEAMARQEPKAVEAKAHRLKGVMGNIGGLVARDIAQKLETMGERGNLTGGAALVESLEKEIERVIAFYRDPTWEQRARAMQGDNDG